MASEFKITHGDRLCSTHNSIIYEAQLHSEHAGKTKVREVVIKYARPANSFNTLKTTTTAATTETDEAWDAFEEEVKLHRYLQDEGAADVIIRLWHSERTPKLCRMILDRAQMDLFALLREQDFHIPLLLRMHLCVDVSGCVLKLHAKGVAHLDIALENFVLLRHKRPKPSNQSNQSNQPKPPKPPKQPERETRIWQVRAIDLGFAGAFAKESEYHINIGKNSRWDNRPIGRELYAHPCLWSHRGQRVNAFLADRYSLAVLLCLILCHATTQFDSANLNYLGFVGHVAHLQRLDPKRFPEYDQWRDLLTTLDQLRKGHLQITEVISVLKQRIDDLNLQNDSHHQQSPSYAQLCSRLGHIVMEQAVPAV